MPLIKFSSTTEGQKGYPIILRAGSVVYTEESNSYIVPNKSIEELKSKNIQFEIAPISNNSKH